MKYFLIIVLLYASILTSGSITALSAEEVIAVVHQDISPEDINRRSVRQAFLGMKTTWTDAPVTLVISREASSESALKYITGRNTQRLLRGWKRLAFSGNGIMPTVVNTNAEAIEIVKTTRGAILLLNYTPKDDPNDTTEDPSEKVLFLSLKEE